MSSLLLYCIISSVGWVDLRKEFEISDCDQSEQTNLYLGQTWGVLNWKVRNNDGIIYTESQQDNMLFTGRKKNLDFIP